jgi:hypothetical protein
MSKNKLIFLISGVILIAIVGILGFKAESKKRVAFENKMRCQSYLENAKKQTEESTALINAFSGNNAQVSQIFFSPIENTCFYTVELSDKNFKRFTTLIRDVLTGQTIETFTIYKDDFLGNPSRYEKYLKDRGAWN